ncbi:MAG: hypothetical protein AAGF71_12820 [Pseudomonadota bacterium]
METATFVLNLMLAGFAGPSLNGHYLVQQADSSQYFTMVASPAEGGRTDIAMDGVVYSAGPEAGSVASAVVSRHPAFHAVVRN